MIKLRAFMFNFLSILCVRTPAQREALKLWLFHSILLGLSGVWIPYYVVSGFVETPFANTLLSGEYLMFAITLSAVSLGFFIKETQTDIKKTATWTYIGLVTVMILAVAARSAVALNEAQVVAKPLKQSFVIWSSVALAGFAILLNHRLLTLEEGSKDLKRVEEQVNRGADNIARQASRTTSSHGIDI